MPPVVYPKGTKMLDITKPAVGVGPAVPVTVVRKQGNLYLVADDDGGRRLLDPLMLLPDTARYRAEAVTYNDRLQALFALGRTKRQAKIAKLEGKLASLRAQEAQEAADHA
jgi:hypothetical protein